MQSDPRARFLDIVLGNETIRVLTDRLAELELPDSYLAAGCLCQTVWNHVSGFPPTQIVDGNLTAEPFSVATLTRVPEAPDVSKQYG